MGGGSSLPQEMADRVILPMAQEAIRSDTPSGLQSGSGMVDHGDSGHSSSHMDIVGPDGCSTAWYVTYLLVGCCQCCHSICNQPQPLRLIFMRQHFPSWVPYL